MYIYSVIIHTVSPAESLALSVHELNALNLVQYKTNSNNIVDLVVILQYTKFYRKNYKHTIHSYGNCNVGNVS